MATGNVNEENIAAAAAVSRRKPLTDALGNYRILRTSPLCEAPFMLHSLEKREGRFYTFKIFWLIVTGFQNL